MQVIAHHNNGREAWRPGVETRMLVSAGNGTAQLCMFEQWVAPGAGAPTHSHPVEEILTVLQGEAEMWIDEARVAVSAGQSLIVPAGRKHGFTQFRRDDTSSPRRAGVGGVRHGRRNRDDAAVGSEISRVRRKTAGTATPGFMIFSYSGCRVPR